MTDLTYINAALSRIGESPISTLIGSSAQQVVASQNYEVLIKGVLSSYPWKFATTDRQLNHLEAEPNLPWTHAYQRPSDLLDLRDVRVDGFSIAYESMGDVILTNEDEDQVVIAVFKYRVPEADWPGWFGEYITQRLEAMFLRGVAEKYEEAEARERNARDVALPEAKNADSKLRSRTNPVSSPTLDARLGVIPRQRLVSR